MKKYLLLLLILPSCIPPSYNRAHVDNWTGGHIDRVIDGIGFYDRTMTAPNGNTIYLWERSNTVQVPVIGSYSQANVVGNSVYGNTLQSGGYSIHRWCRAAFEVNEENIVVRWRAEGNACN